MIESRKKDKLEAVKQQKEVQELQYVDTIYPHENHKLYKICKKTGAIVEAMFLENVTYRFRLNWKKGDKIPPHKELIIEQGFDYVSALNERTALKKFKERKSGSKKDRNKQYLTL